MAQALYRRYRPDTFADLIGQEHVSGTLMAALDGGRVSHAYLFSGPRGCGKTTSARIMARCLNCVEGPTSTPCGVCDSCVELASGGPGSLDVIEMDAASNRGIEDARGLRERTEFAPVRDRFKVVILDEAHMVTKEGANALLKLIEEPPPHVKFIFATTEPEKMLPTVRSRTHHYQFRLVPPQVLAPYLQTICEREGVSPEPGVLDLVVRAGGGSVRDSLSVLDQLLAGTVEGVLPYERSAALLGYTSASLLDSVVEAIGNNDGGTAFQGIEDVVASGVDPKRFAEDLLQRLRDLIICALAPEQAGAILSHIPAGQLEEMKAQALAWGSRRLSQQADVVEEGLTKMVGAAAPRLLLELLIGRLLAPTEEVQPPVSPSAPPAAASVPARTAPPTPAAPEPRPDAAASTAPVAPERAVTERPPAPTAPPAQTPRESERNSERARPALAPVSPPTSGSASGISAAEALAKWPQVVDAAGKRTAVAGALLRSVHVQVVDQTFYVDAGALAGRIGQNKAKIDEALQEVMGAGWSWTVGAAPSKGEAPPKASAPSAAPTPIINEPDSAPHAYVQPASAHIDEPPIPDEPPAPEESFPPSSPSVASQPTRGTSPTLAAPPAPAEDVEPPSSHDSSVTREWFPDGDVPSMDDENVDVHQTKGLSLVLEILGGQVLDDSTEGV